MRPLDFTIDVDGSINPRERRRSLARPAVDRRVEQKGAGEGEAC
jgi:hypothetical protein